MSTDEEFERDLRDLWKRLEDAGYSDHANYQAAKVLIDERAAGRVEVSQTHQTGDTK